MLVYLEREPMNASLRADAFDRAVALHCFSVAQELGGFAIERFPADISWRQRMGYLSMAEQRWEDARAWFRSARHLVEQDEPVLQYNLAYIDFVQGSFADARAQLEPLLGSASEAGQTALALWLRTLHRQGELQPALDYFVKQAAPGMSPSAEAFGAAGLVALDLGDLARAREGAEAALAVSADNQEALVMRGTVALADRDAIYALKLFRQALQRSPTDGRTRAGAAMALLLKGELQSAKSMFTAAVEHMPDHIGTWHGLGWCEIALGDLSAALNAFERALLLDRAFSETHGGISVVMALQGKHAEAIEEIRRARGLDPRGLSFRFAEAVISGDTTDRSRFQVLVESALAGHSDGQGRGLAEVIFAHN